MFKVLITGGEKTSNYDFFRKTCAKLLRNKAKEGKGIMLYSTGDKFVDQFASEYRISLEKFNTNWSTYGKEALKERNKAMLSDCNALIYFIDGIKDNEIIFNMAKDRGIQIRRINIE